MEDKSHFSKSTFVKESLNTSENVMINVNHTKPLEFDLNTNKTNTCYETNEKQGTVQNENVENSSITKKSALQFFKNVIEDNKVEKSSNHSNIASSPGPYRKESPVGKFDAKNFSSSETYNIEENVSNNSFKQFNDTEVILEPGPPPTFDYMPRAQTLKKDQMTERLKRLSTNQKLLSPEQIPSGAVRIFPDVTSEKKQEITEEICVKKEVIESRVSGDTLHQNYSNTSYASPSQTSEYHTPLLRPRADIEVRPGSPRPSAEAISMEKLWTKSHSHQVQKSPVTYSPVQTKTYSSSESQSYVSETIEKNGQLVKNESREEKQGSIDIDDGVKKVSEKFSEISVGNPMKHVEPPRNQIKRPASANVFNEVTSKNSFLDNTVQTQHFSDGSSQFKSGSSYVRQSHTPLNSEKKSFTKSEWNLDDSQAFNDNVQKTSQFLPERFTGLIKHVESPKSDKIFSNKFTRAHSEETSMEKQWKSQSPVVFKGPPQNKTYSMFEAHSSFSKSLEKDGVLVASEKKEEGGRTVDDGVQRVYDSFSERSKLPTNISDLAKNTNKSNSIKTMQKMFEQTASSSNVASNMRPYSRMKSRASESDFESEAELTKYNVEQNTSDNISTFESKMYSSKTHLQETKNSSIVMQSPVKESGYVADTDEPRGFQSEAATNHQTFNSRKNPGFQSTFIKKVRCVFE